MRRRIQLLPTIDTAGRQRVLLALTVGASLLVHTLVAMGVYNKALGQLDTGTFKQYRQVKLVRMPAQDIDALSQREVNTESIIDKPMLPQLSEQMLEPDTTMSAQRDAQGPPAEFRSADDQRPSDTLAQNQQPDGPTDLPQDVMHKMLTAPPVNLPEMKLHGLDNVADAGATSIGGGGQGAGEGYARELLSGGGAQLPKASGEPGAWAPAMPQTDEQRPDQRPQPQTPEPALPPQSLDVIDTALRGTTKLPAPEVLDDDFDYVVTVYDPRNDPENTKKFFGGKQPVPDDQAYVRIDVTPKRSLARLKTMPKDMIVIVDTSSSIPQIWVDAVMQGVKDGLASLNEGDRFNVVLFNEKVAMFSSDGPVPYNAKNLAAAQKFLSGARSVGYTDMNQALARLMRRDVANERVYDLLLISDGRPTRGVLDTRELINLITRDNDLAASIYCVGIGEDQNRKLLEFLAYRNKGFCLYAEAIPQTPNVLRDMMSRLRYPILKNVNFSVMGLDYSSMHPQHVPNIHQGQSFSIFGRFDTYHPFTVRMFGQNASEPKDFTFTRDLAKSQRGPRQIAFDWAFWKLHHLYSEMIRLNNDPKIQQQIESLRKQFKIETLY